jgi:hypothetical protein
MSQIKGLDKFSSHSPNAEYAYLIDDDKVWFIDYVIGIAFRTPIDFTTVNSKSADYNNSADTNLGLLESGRPYREFSDFKDFQDYMEDYLGQEIVMESTIDPTTHIEGDDRRITWHVNNDKVSDTRS